MTESTVSEEKPSSWFTNFGLTPNLTNTLTNLSSSIVDATSKVGTAASSFQKTIQERLYTSNENEQQTSETTKPTKDLTSTLSMNHIRN